MARMLFIFGVIAGSAAIAEDFRVDPNSGNSKFDAVFDSKVGERITATSSSVECDASYDESSGKISGICSVPLTSIKVDNEDTKTEHFQQWVTNKKTDPKQCRFEANFTGVKVGTLAPETATKFVTEVPFTVCGRRRSDGGKEKVSGTAILFPAGSYGESKTIRVRATVKNFDRDQYHIGPKYTDGWLSRVQSLAKVVADQGTIDLSLFAKVKNTSAAKE